MKKIKSLLSLALALVFVCTGAIAVSASASLPDETPPAITESAADTGIPEQTPQIVDVTPDTPYEETSDDTTVEDNAAVPISDGDTDPAEESQEEQQPQPDRKKSSNTPYFVGAVIAVIIFIGVALYCKFNGGGARR